MTISSNKFVQQIIGNNKEDKVETKPYLALSTDWRRNVSRVLLTGVIKNQFYRNMQDAIDEATKLLPFAAKEDPAFLLKAVSFARDVNMKGMVKVAIAALYAYADDEFLSQQDVRAEIVNILGTFHPGQLLQFVEIIKSKKFGKGLGSRSQKWVRDVMEGWSESKLEYYTLKYPKDLNILARLVHPRYDDRKGGILDFIITNNKKKFKAKRQLAFEKLKTFYKNDSNKAANFIIEENIPFDTVKGIGFKMTPDFAMAEMVQMHLSSLLLNIRSLENHGVFNNKEGIKALELKMKEVQNARSIAIDFAKPYLHCSSQSVKDVLLQAMADMLSVPMPFLESKRIGVSVDISGSMSGDALRTSGLLCVPFLKSNNLWFTTFNERLHEEGSRLCPKLNNKKPLNQIRELLGLTAIGGTNISASIESAILNNIKLDLMVIITDEQQNIGTRLMDTWKRYKKSINANAELWIINATNYEWTACDYKDPSVTVYQSLTPAIFKNIDFVGMDLVQAINSRKLGGSKDQKKLGNVTYDDDLS